MEISTEKKENSYRQRLQSLYEDGKASHWVFDDDLQEFSENMLTDIISLPRLYRYSPVDYWNIRNLEMKQIRLTPLGKLNDALEGVPSQEKSSTEASPDFGFVKCFSESEKEPLMWAHYADNSKGMCVEYDLTRLSDEEKKILYYLFPVVYTDRRYPHADIQSIKRDLKMYRADSSDLTTCICVEDYFYLQDILPLLLVKGPEWACEKEWRIAVDILSKEQRCNDIIEKLGDKLPKIDEDDLIAFDCVSAVYMGVKIQKSVREHIVEVVKGLNNSMMKSKKPIKLYEMRYAPSTFKLEPYEVSLDTQVRKDLL